MEERANSNAVLVLVGNQTDVSDRVVSTADGEEYARRHNMLYIETSAMTGSGIEEGFGLLCREIENRQNLGELDNSIGAKPVPIADVSEAGREVSYKCILVGDSGVGKTAILGQFVFHEFREVESSLVPAWITGHTTGNVPLAIWDFPGAKPYSAICRPFFRNSFGALLVFSVANHDSFEHIEEWRQVLSGVVSPNVVLILVGNRTDDESNRKVSEDEARGYARSHNMLYMETSARTRSGIQEVFDQLGRVIQDKISRGDLQSE
jgi:small GTP-binding protein